MRNNTIYHRFPIFGLKIIYNEKFIVGSEFINLKNMLPSEKIDNEMGQEITQQLNKYIDNPNTIFDLPLNYPGTIFQRNVWENIKTIKAGTTVSYKYISEKINSAPRAVGNACGRNPLPIFIPCHRVINTNGQLGGFMLGVNKDNLAIKRWLLIHEKVL